MIALITSGEASASPMPSRPSSVRIRTSTTSWQLAVFCCTDSTRRTWQMSRAIFMRGASARRVRVWPGRLPGRRALLEGLLQHGDAFGHGDVRVFLAFHFEGDVPGVTGGGQDPGNAPVIEIEGIPFAAPVIGLGLHEHRLRRDLFEFGIGFLEKVAG